MKAGGEDSELNGGSGSNILLVGPGNDTLVLGSAVNVVGGGAGNNTVVITTPMAQGGLIVGGSDEHVAFLEGREVELKGIAGRHRLYALARD